MWKGGRSERPALLDLKRLADRVATLEELPRERLVDDCDACGGCVIVIVEVTAGDDRRSQRPEESAADAVEIGETRDRAIDDDVVVPGAAVDRREKRLRGGADAGDCPNALDDLPDEHGPAFWRNARVSQVEAGHQDTGRDEAGVERRQLAKRSTEQQGADDEHQRERDLKHDEAAADHDALTAIARPAPIRLHRVARARVRDAKGGRQSEQHTRQAGQHRHESEHPPVPERDPRRRGSSCRC